MRECRVLKTNELWRLYWQPWRTLLIVSARNAKWPIKNMSKFYKHSFKDFFINRCSKPFTLCPAFVQFQYKTPLPSLSQPCLCNNCGGGGRTTLLKAGPSCDYMHNHGRAELSVIAMYARFLAQSHLENNVTLSHNYIA